MTNKTPSYSDLWYTLLAEGKLVITLNKADIENAIRRGLTYAKRDSGDFAAKKLYRIKTERKYVNGKLELTFTLSTRMQALALKPYVVGHKVSLAEM